MPSAPRAPSRRSSTEDLHPLSEDLDQVPTEEVVSRLHREDLRAFEAVGEAAFEVARAADAAAEALRRGGRMIYVGAGTSGRLGVLDASECPPTFGVSPSRVRALMAGGDRALRRAVEDAEDDAEAGARALRGLKPGPRDWVCGISASATTPFVLGALRAARQAQCRTALVCCAPVAGQTPPAEVIVFLNTGPELLAGSTRLKAGTATKLVLNAISTAAMIRLGRVYRGRMVELRPTNAKLRTRARRMVEALTGLAPRAAARLLEAAGGTPKVAVAMHFAGVPRREAENLLRKGGLRSLEPGRAPLSTRP